MGLVIGFVDSAVRFQTLASVSQFYKMLGDDLACLSDCGLCNKATIVFGIILRVLSLYTASDANNEVNQNLMVKS